MRRGREKRRVSVETARGEKEKKKNSRINLNRGGGMNPGKKIPGPRRERPPDRRWEMSSAHKLVLKKEKN
jgi:hypothetical protein